VISFGIGAFWFSFFHLVSHAFFKSSLFLIIGFIIHRFFSQQDSRLFRVRAGSSFLVQFQFSCILFCLCGLFFRSGFVSKDLVLEFFIVRVEGIIIVSLFFIGVWITFVYRRRLFFVFLKVSEAFSLAVILNRVSFYLSCICLFFSSISCLWWGNVNIFRFPYLFLFIDKGLIIIFLIFIFAIFFTSSKVFFKIFSVLGLTENFVKFTRLTYFQLKISDWFLIWTNSLLRFYLSKITFSTVSSTLYLKSGIASLLLLILFLVF